MVYGDPDPKILTVVKKIVGMSNSTGEPGIQSEPVVRPPQGWVAIGNHHTNGLRRKK
jgi:hypothetical protein